MNLDGSYLGYNSRNFLIDFGWNSAQKIYGPGRHFYEKMFVAGMRNRIGEWILLQTRTWAFCVQTHQFQFEANLWFLQDKLILWNTFELEMFKLEGFQPIEANVRGITKGISGNFLSQRIFYCTVTSQATIIERGHVASTVVVGLCTLKWYHGKPPI